MSMRVIIDSANESSEMSIVVTKEGLPHLVSLTIGGKTITVRHRELAKALAAVT